MSLFIPAVSLAFTADEWAIVNRPIVGDGGAQGLLRRCLEHVVITEQVIDDEPFNQHISTEMEDADLQKLYRLAYSYGGGGFQEQAKAILKAAFRAGWVPA